MTVRGIRRMRGTSSGDQSQQTDPIASIAKELAQTQNSTMNRQPGITDLLNQISQQLSQLQNQNSPIQQANQGMQNNSQANSNLQTGQQSGQISNMNQQQDPAANLQLIISQLLQANQQGQAQSQLGSNDVQSWQRIGQQKTPDNVKTAAQALSEAQFELSVELENSLKKLRQVINDSEKLADKISKLLGEEKKTPQS